MGGTVTKGGGGSVHTLSMQAGRVRHTWRQRASWFVFFSSFFPFLFSLLAQPCGHVPLSVAARRVWFFGRGVRGTEVTKAPLATGSHVRDVPQAVVQGAPGGGL